MSYVIIKTVVKDGEEYWDVTFEAGHHTLASKADVPDAFQLVDEFCAENLEPLPMEWRYE